MPGLGQPEPMRQLEISYATDVWISGSSHEGETVSSALNSSEMPGRKFLNFAHQVASTLATQPA